MTEADKQHHIFGIRHHGPGSALALQQALEDLDPDILLVEGPPDGNAIVNWINHPQMILPAAMLIYRPDKPQSAAYYPYTKFSPETQAVRFALARDRPVRFADLPQRYLMAAGARPSMPGQDLFQTLAEATGHPSYEEWWNLAIEQRRDSTAVFAAVLELMTALREETLAEEEQDGDGLLWAKRREASMRQAIRDALAAGFKRVAFICGAWHAPALLDLSSTREDIALLENLDEVEVEATWVPWTYGRLAMHSGYGAGIRSPGWYDHLWTRAQAGDSLRQTTAGWLARVSALLREQGFSASPANVIEAMRLAEALAAMRGLPFPGLPELNESVIAVLCDGDQAQMDLIARKLIVGERMGMVPPDTPMVPLQRDLLRLQKELDLFPEPEPAALKLDLRQDLDLERSRLLHRLLLLGIPWGDPGRQRGQSNIALENWTIQWHPDFPVRIIEASLWGNTVVEAASAWVDDDASKMNKLAELTGLLDRVILADLPQAVAAIIARIEDESAVSSDVPHMMAALPPLARVLRYGSSRQIDQQTLQKVVNSLLTRICIGLPSTCAAMDDDPAHKMADQLNTVTTVVHTLRDPQQAAEWHDALLATLKQPNLHGILDGRASRILLDDDVMTAETAARRMERALRRSSLVTLSPDQAAQSAAWLDGFLAGSELLLIHDRRLWRLLDGFINDLPHDRFVEILPLLRRAFSNYSEAARRQLKELSQSPEDAPLREMSVHVDFNHERAEAVLPLISEILGK